MKIEVRPSEPCDAEAIFQLRCDPRLNGMQYSPSLLESPESLFTCIDVESEIPIKGLKSSTILVEGAFAGHITHSYSTTRKRVTQCSVGWNILPELWGQQIMPTAVSIFLDDRFRLHQDIEFVAFCFTSNLRSRRVIEKLGFEQEPPTHSDKFLHFLRSFGRQKIRKYRLTNAAWCGRNQLEERL